ncbi:MAG: outer membrane beta-barrel family protein [Muribaculaceae bacterium]|nr:outer membrane beta-barrel family protein [Muribaculaceae bacterium]
MKIMFLIFLTFFPAIGTAQTTGGDERVTNDSTFTVELGDITVTAKRNLQRLSKGGLLTEVKGTSLSELGTCADVIAQLPGVISNEGVMEILGRGTPVIYINNRKLVNKSEIERLSSKEILSVEILFNPGVKYGAETKAVILVKTIRKQGEGLSGSGSINGRLAHYLSQSDNLSLNYRKGGVDIFCSFDYNSSRLYQQQHTQTNTQTSRDFYIIDSEMLIYPKFNTYTGNIGGNFQIDGNNFVGMRYEYSATPYYESKWITKEKVKRNNIKEDELLYDTNWKGKSVPVHLFNLYYQGKVKSFDISINNDYYYKHTSNIQTIIENSLTEGIEIIRSDNAIRNSMFASKGTAEYSFGGHTLEFGYEITATDRKDIFNNEGYHLPDSDDKIKELTGAGYIAVNIPIKKVELYAGVRYENTYSRYFQRGILLPEQTRRYNRFFPNVDFTFPINKAKFTLSYESKTKRPLYSQLSSSIQYDDRFTYEAGNPFLTSEMIHSFSLAGIYRWIFFNATYIYDKNAIISIFHPYTEDSPQNIMSYENFNHLSKYNIVISLSPRISRWSPRLRLNLMGQFFSIDTDSGIKKLNAPILFFNFFNSLALGKGFNFNGEISGRTRGDMDVVTLKPSWQINLGLSKSVRNWFFQFQATDIFKTARGSMITYGTRVTLDKWNYSDTQSLRLIIRYSFNTAMSKYKGKGAGISERNRL